MTDEEVEEWLDGAERERAESGLEAQALARALAETRKALAGIEHDADGKGGPVTRREVIDLAMAFYATMPRPKG